MGGLTYDAAGRLLLVQRANEPGRGLWSLPGGRVEPGEDDEAALVREMAEETGLAVQPGALVGRVRRGPYEISDYRCPWSAATLRAGDDAPTPAGATPPSWPRSRSSAWSTRSPGGTPCPACDRCAALEHGAALATPSHPPRGAVPTGREWCAVL